MYYWGAAHPNFNLFFTHIDQQTTFTVTYVYWRGNTFKNSAGWGDMEKLLFSNHPLNQGFFMVGHFTSIAVFHHMSLPHPRVFHRMIFTTLGVFTE